MNTWGFDDPHFVPYNGGLVQGGKRFAQWSTGGSRVQGWGEGSMS